MNKFFMLLASLMLVLSLAACGGNNGGGNNGGGTDQAANNGENGNMGNGNNNNGANGNNGNNGNGNNGGGQSNLTVSNEAGVEVEKLEEVNNAIVIVDGQNAYVAAGLRDDVTGDDNLQQRIADQARSVLGDMENVYVSMDPNFFEQLQGYGDQINQGQGGNGLIGDFQNAMQQVFPTNPNNNNTNNNANNNNNG